MEIARLTLEFLDVLAWPLVFLVGLFLFRKELRILAGSLKKITLPGGTELDWRKQLRDAEEAADKVEALPKATHEPKAPKQQQNFSRQLQKFGLLTSPSDHDFSYYKHIAASNPNLALAGLRIELDRMLQNLAKVFGTNCKNMQTATGRLAVMLRNEGILEKEEYELLRSVFNVANAALHGRDVTVRDSVRTIDSAEAFLDHYIPFMTGALDRYDAEGRDLPN